MPKPRLSVRKTKEILRLRFECGLSERKIAVSCRIARSTVADYLSRAAEAGLTWPLPEDFSDDKLEQLLFPISPAPSRGRSLPNWEHVHIDPVMRIQHKAGEKLFVDYAEMTVPVIDTQRAEERRAQIFVATLGASNYTYVEATWTQSLPDWIGAHVRAFAFFGGVPRLPDNLTSGIAVLPRSRS